MLEIRLLFPFSLLSSMAKMVFWISCSSKTNPVVKEYFCIFRRGSIYYIDMQKKKKHPSWRFLQHPDLKVKRTVNVPSTVVSPLISVGNYLPIPSHFRTLLENCM